MENLITEVWGLLTTSIDFIFVIICNIATYVVISVIESVKKGWVIPTWWKRAISGGMALIIGVVMFFCFHRSGEGLFYGFFIQFLTWDYLFKHIIERIVNKVKVKKDEESE